MSTGEIAVADSGTAVGRARIAVLNATEKDDVSFYVALLYMIGMSCRFFFLLQ